MKKHINYEDMTKICNEINEKYIPAEDAFFDKVDEIFEQANFEGYALIQHSFIELLKVVDLEIKKIENKARITPTCEIGCSHCCYFPIITTKLEAKLMISTINNLPDDQKIRIKNHFTEYFTKYSKDIEKLCSIDFEEVSDFKHQYISGQLPCPLLNVETNKCLAYDIRPIPCRTYLNYCSPVVCKEDFIPKEPFSYEFLREYYIEALNELIQTIIYEENDNYGIQYPDDLLEVDYLPNLLNNEQFMKNAK